LNEQTTDTTAETATPATAPDLPSTISQLGALIASDADPLTAGVKALCSLWDSVQAIPCGARVLHRIFGTNLSGEHPSCSVATTYAGLARPFGGSEAETNLPAIIAAARAGGGK
jgi:hypothetical protein